jgi:hypothetical protein
MLKRDHLCKAKLMQHSNTDVFDEEARGEVAQIENIPDFEFSLLHLFLSYPHHHLLIQIQDDSNCEL